MDSRVIKFLAGLFFVLPFGASQAAIDCSFLFGRFGKQVANLTENQRFINDVTPVRNELSAQRKVLLAKGIFDTRALTFKQNKLTKDTIHRLQEKLKEFSNEPKDAMVESFLRELEVRGVKLLNAKVVNYAEYIETTRRYLFVLDFLIHNRIKPTRRDLAHELGRFAPHKILEAEKDYFGRVDAGARTGLFGFPQFHELDVPQLNDLVAHGIFPLGITFEPETLVDGFFMRPHEFFVHDIQHLEDLANPSNPFLGPNLQGLKNFRLAVGKIAKNPTEVRLGEVLWFVRFHDKFKLPPGLTTREFRAYIRDLHQELKDEGEWASELVSIVEMVNSDHFNPFVGQDISLDELLDFLKRIDTELSVYD